MKIDTYLHIFYRISTNEDMFIRLFLCSDPMISLSKKLPKKTEPLTTEMKGLTIFEDEDDNELETDCNEYSSEDKDDDEFEQECNNVYSGEDNNDCDNETDRD